MVAALELTLERAVSIVIRGWRNRKTRRILANFPSAKELRAAFLDQEALAAGAQDNPMYCASALRARELIRQSPEVCAAIHSTWDEARGKHSTMTRDEYFKFYRKLYLHLACERLIAEGEPPTVSATEAHAFAVSDWRRDVGDDSAEMEFETFGRSLFQLADLHVEGLDANAYAKWIGCAHDACLHASDADLLEQLHAALERVHKAMLVSGTNSSFKAARSLMAQAAGALKTPASKEGDGDEGGSSPQGGRNSNNSTEQPKAQRVGSPRATRRLKNSQSVRMKVNSVEGALGAIERWKKGWMMKFEKRVVKIGFGSGYAVPLPEVARPSRDAPAAASKGAAGAAVAALDLFTVEEKDEGSEEEGEEEEEEEAEAVQESWQNAPGRWKWVLSRLAGIEPTKPFEARDKWQWALRTTLARKRRDQIRQVLDAPTPTPPDVSAPASASQTGLPSAPSREIERLAAALDASGGLAPWRTALHFATIVRRQSDGDAPSPRLAFSAPSPPSSSPPRSLVPSPRAKLSNEHTRPSTAAGILVSPRPLRPVSPSPFRRGAKPSARATFAATLAADDDAEPVHLPSVLTRRPMTSGSARPPAPPPEAAPAVKNKTLPAELEHIFKLIDKAQVVERRHARRIADPVSWCAPPVCVSLPVRCGRSRAGKRVERKLIREAYGPFSAWGRACDAPWE